MQIKLKVVERIQLINLLNEFKGNITGLYKIIKIFDQIELSEKERKNLNIEQVGNSIKWDFKKEKDKQIDFEETQIEFIKKIFEAKNERQEFSLGDKFLLGIAEKLKIKFDDEPEIKIQPVAPKNKLIKK